MKKKLVLIFLFHIICLLLLLVPNEFQGPLMFEASGVQLRVMDVGAILMIIAGSAVLNIFIISQYWPQIKKLREILKEAKN